MFKYEVEKSITKDTSEEKQIAKEELVQEPIKNAPLQQKIKVQYASEVNPKKEKTKSNDMKENIDIKIPFEKESP